MLEPNQLSLADQDRHMLFVFRLEGEISDPAVRPAALQKGARYRVLSPFPGEFEERVLDGSELATSGIDASAIEPRRSLVLLLDPVTR